MPMSNFMVSGGNVSRVIHNWDKLSVSGNTIVKNVLYKTYKKTSSTIKSSNENYTSSVNVELMPGAIPFYRAYDVPSGMYQGRWGIYPGTDYYSCSAGDVIFLLGGSLNFKNAYKLTFSDSSYLADSLIDYGSEYLLIGIRGHWLVDKSTLSYVSGSAFTVNSQTYDHMVAKYYNGRVWHIGSVDVGSNWIAPSIIVYNTDGTLSLARAYKTDYSSDWADDIVEVDGGYVIFSDTTIIKIDKNGNAIKAIRINLPNNVTCDNMFSIIDKDLNIVKVYCLSGMEVIGSVLSNGILYIYGYVYNFGGDDAGIIAIGADNSILFNRAYTYTGATDLAGGIPYKDGIFVGGIDETYWQAVMILENGTLETTSDVTIHDLTNINKVEDVTDKASVEYVPVEETDISGLINSASVTVTVSDITSNIVEHDYTR